DIPPYSQFLNLIEYSFHWIKAYVQSKEPLNWEALVSEIRNAITSAIYHPKMETLFQ
ncbi:hypothetical protein VP01_4966g1, partial [Puccinia sorghi]